MSQFVYFNGRIVRAAKAAISINDRAVLHGYGLFETLRAYNGIPFRIDDHLRRMARSARALRIPMPSITRRFSGDLKRLIVLNRMPDCAVRITLTAGDGHSGGSLFVTLRDLPPLPDRLYRTGARLVIVPWRRSASSPILGHKTLNYLENILARELAARAGAVDAIFTGENGHLMEGTASNLFLVRGGSVLTPAPGDRILAGITRKIIFGLCREIDLPVRETTLTAADLHRADEVFITNALIEVMPVTRVGAWRIEGGTVARRLLDRYREKVYRAIRPRSGA